MGIDIYLRWKNMKECNINKFERGYYIYEKDTSFDSPSRYLFKECFEENQLQTYPYQILKDRLPFAMKILINNIEKITFNMPIDDMKFILEEYICFVLNMEKLEKETGENCQVYISFI